jgi:hypothetical protein
MQKASKRFLFAILALLIATTCGAQSAHEATKKPRPAKSIVYTNKQYGFKFTLPKSWKGYRIIVSGWCATVWEPTSSEEPALRSTRIERGPKIAIRNPHWSEANPYQDIPIMVFTLSQWDLIEKGELVVSTAPFGPGELGRNSRYVFALPPRYNVAEAIGIPEVQDIMSNDPLHAF